MKQVEGAFFYATRTRTGQIGPNLPCHAPAEAWMKQLWTKKRKSEIIAPSGWNMKLLLTQNCRKWWANRKLDTYREDNSTCDVGSDA